MESTSRVRWRGFESRLSATRPQTGEKANTLRNTGLPVVIFTTRGREWQDQKNCADAGGARRRVRLVASQGGSPEHPNWYYNLKADPDALMVQDGAERFDARGRELEGEERRSGGGSAPLPYPPYAEYQTRTERTIPVLLAERRA